MKKILSTIACATILATTASADFARVEMGAGAWMNTPSGTLTYDDGSGATGTYTSSEKDATSGYLWMLVKHPIPVLPNIRLEYTSIEDEGTATGTFNDFDTPANTGVTASLKMTQYDIIPYYNILDNTAWITLDLGLDIKVIDTTYQADGVQLAGISGSLGTYEDSTAAIVPLVYARTRVEIPATNIGFEADVKYITYNGSTVSDIRAKVDYTLDFIPVVQPGLEVGYRMQKFDLVSDDEKTKTNLDFSGVYVGLMVRF